MYKYIWLVPLLPLIGAAINGLLGRALRFSEQLIGGIAIGSIALAFLISVAAVYSYGTSSLWPNPFVTDQQSSFGFTWIAGGAVRLTQGENAATPADPEQNKPAKPGAGGLLNIEWTYQLDSLSAVFMLIITGVGLCIFVFATGYMHGETGFYRFFAYMGLFMFMMLVLVMGSNFLMMFVGWEGVGLCSYLLIGYYFERQEAANASRKAFITNRVGDFGFALAVFGIIAMFGSPQYTHVMSQAAGYPVETLGHWGVMSWIALGLFIGACGKSAQLPLYVWLPDAMAGPTPVSALIHAATMVTAGLYMLTRTNVIFQHSQTMLLVVAIVGAATALFAATIGITQNDIKKVLAYSTVSQLGFMFLACGVGAFSIAIFHVMTHAFFKALMFLGAGSVIHGMHHEQDMRRMGGLQKYMPYTYWTFLAGWLAICGIIPFSGFWSKDEILWRAVSTTQIPSGWIFWLVGTIAATCTAFYMTRLMAMTFWGEPKFLDAHKHTPAHEAHLKEHSTPGKHAHTPHESPRSMWVPLAALAILAVVGGLVGIGPAFTPSGHGHPGGRLNIVTWLDPIIWNQQTGGFGEAGAAETANLHEGIESGKGIQATVPRLEAKVIEPHSGEEAGETHAGAGFNLAHSIEKSAGHRGTEVLFILISLAAAGIGIGLGLLFYVKDRSLPDVWAARLGPLYRASYNKYWVDEFYGWAITRRVMDLARVVYAVDSKAVDGGVNGVAWLTRLSSRITGLTDKYFVDGLVNTIANFVITLVSPVLRAAQTGLAQNYALMMVLGLLIAVALLFWRAFTSS
jgi:NADH-quinone oxidoreductase subunit L